MIAWAVLRALGVGVIVGWLAGGVSQVRRRWEMGYGTSGDESKSSSPISHRLSPRLSRLWLAAVLLLPAFMPGLLVGYAYRPEGLAWVLTRWKADGLHGLIMVSRTLPWAVLVAWLVGVRGQTRADVAWRQTRVLRSRWSHRVGETRLWMGRNRGLIAGGLAAALLTFQEAEIAALLQARGWTETTFRRLAGGWSSGDVVRGLWPVVGIVLGTLFALWRVTCGERVESRGGGRQWGMGDVARAVVIGSCFVAAVLIPVGRLLGDAWDGLAALWQQRSLWREVALAILAAGVTATLAQWLARSFLGRARLLPSRGRGEKRSKPDDGGVKEAARHDDSVETEKPFTRTAAPRERRPPVVSRSRTSAVIGLLVAYGALGSLLAAVLMQAVAYDVLGGRLPGLIPQYASLTCVLLPVAIALEVLVSRRTMSRPTLATRQLLEHGDATVRRHMRQLWWRQTIGPRVLAWGWLFWTAFWDLQTAALLAPPGYATAPGRLYNLAHYGQNESLAAMLVVLPGVACVVPVAVLTISAWWSKRPSETTS